jgi:hypothetical protein
MKGYNLHDSDLTEIVMKGEVEQSYMQFVNSLKLKNKPLTLESAFIAGWMLANPNLRQKLKLNREKEIVRNLHFN